MVQIQWYKFGFAFCFAMLFYSCSSKKQVAQQMSNQLCTCAEPVIAWRNHLQADPASLTQSSEIQKQLQLCLAPLSQDFERYKNDEAFIELLTTNMKAKCPESNTSLAAMLKLLNRAVEKN